MPGPTAFCQYRQKVHESAQGDPLVPQGRLPNWLYCMYKRQKGAGVLQETRPGMLPGRVEVRLCDFNTPKKGGVMGSK